jgi:hypothetical protein
MTTSENFRKTSAFKWTPKTSKAAVLLANGYTQAEAGAEVGVTDRTIRTWLDHQEFAHEVDKLTLLVGFAQKVERLRLTNRMIRQLSQRNRPTSRDLLDWMRFAQSETDGAKLDFAALADVFNAGAGDTDSIGNNTEPATDAGGGQ